MSSTTDTKTTCALGQEHCIKARNTIPFAYFNALEFRMYLYFAIDTVESLNPLELQQALGLTIFQAKGVYFFLRHKDSY